jgi:ABC-type lipoprotein export system ATPase subunit
MIELSNISKTYYMKQTALPVLHDVSLKIQEGEFVALMGASGSGKSTLLHIAGALDKPDRGSVMFRGISMDAMSTGERHRMRNEQIGFVFQFYHLLPELTVLENVLLPAMVKAPLFMALVGARPAKAEGIDLLTRLGLKERMHHLPSELSGGEKQRAAIARAMINKPALLLADEPTGNLDSATGKKILQVFLDMHKLKKLTILMVTHDANVAAAADRTIRIADGRLV